VLWALGHSGIAAHNGSGRALEGASLFSGPGNPSAGTGAHAALLANEQEKKIWMAKDSNQHNKFMWIEIAGIALEAPRLAYSAACEEGRWR
jgi:hypothetical protein